METLVFVVGVAALLLHELDAIRQHEWRFFLGWTGLDDDRAYRIFTAAHLPLLVLILVLLDDPRFQTGLDVFLVGHALAHFALRHHPLIRFNNPFSRLWIYGGALAGLLHLALVFL